MLNPSDSTADQLNRIEELKARLKTRRQQRSDAVKELQECADQVAQDTPADSSIFYIKKDVSGNGTGASGVLLLSEADQVEVRKKQLIEERKKRSKVLQQLKQTSYLCIQKLRPTEYLDPHELQRRLAASPEEDARASDSGSVSA